MFNVSDFTKVNKLGEGTYGVVVKAVHKTTGQIVAIKEFNRNDEVEDGITSTTLREVVILKELVHPNIVPLLGASYIKSRLYLIFDFLQCDLKHYLDMDDILLHPSVIQNFLYQILQGLYFCHIRSYLHRDLKPANILVDTKNMILKIADFGLARLAPVPVKPLTHEVITLWYRPPEILLGCKRYGSGADIWSVACIFAEMARKEVLFRGDSEINQIQSIFKYLGVPNEDYWTNLRDCNSRSFFPSWNYCLNEVLEEYMNSEGFDLINGMLIFNATDRTSTKSALLHPYFANLDRSKVPSYGEEYTSCPREALKMAIKQ